MDSLRAKSIGGKLALKSMIAGLVIAQIIMTLLASSDGLQRGFFWFLRGGFIFNILFAVFISLSLSYWIGRYAGKAILIKPKDMIKQSHF